MSDFDPNQHPRGGDATNPGRFSANPQDASSAAFPSTPASPRYLSATETAAIMRGTLKRAFPGQKFSVRTDKYAGGATVHVSWTDGPPEREVEQVTNAFSGSGFDGMIDMRYEKDSWLDADGTAHFAGTSGTEGSRGVVAEAFGSAPGPDAELVSFGADFVFTHRELSDGFLDEAATRFAGPALTVTAAEECRECRNWMKPGHEGAAIARSDHDWQDAVCSARCGGRREARFGHIRPSGTQ